MMWILPVLAAVISTVSLSRCCEVYRINTLCSPTCITLEETSCAEILTESSSVVCDEICVLNMNFTCDFWLLNGNQTSHLFSSNNRTTTSVCLNASSVAEYAGCLRLQCVDGIDTQITVLFLGIISNRNVKLYYNIMQMQDTA